jgi:hypothetical protein
MQLRAIDPSHLGATRSLARLLSAWSSRHTGGNRSSSTAQLTLAFSHSMYLSCSLIVPSSFQDRPGRGRLNVCPFYLLRHEIPATAKPERDKGVHRTGARSATHPCGATCASGNAFPNSVLTDTGMAAFGRGSSKCHYGISNIYRPARLVVSYSDRVMMTMQEHSALRALIDTNRR